MNKKFFLYVTLSGLLLLGVGCVKGGVSDKRPSVSAGNERRAVDCSMFGKKGNIQAIGDKDLQQATEEYVEGYAKNDRGYMPEDFVDKVSGATLCGSIKDAPSAYDYLHSASFYISAMSVNDLFETFRYQLKTRGCEAGEVTSPTFDKSLVYMPFTCKDGKGTFNPDPNRQAYSINFDLKK